MKNFDIWVEGRSISGNTATGETSGTPLDAESYAALRFAGRRIEFPEALTAIDGNNEISLLIYSKLKQAVIECGALLDSRSFSRFLNLPAVLFHELQTSLSGVAIKSIELDVCNQLSSIALTRSKDQQIKNIKSVNYWWLMDPKSSYLARQKPVSLKSSLKNLVKTVERIKTVLTRPKARILYSSPLSMPSNELRKALGGHRQFTLVQAGKTENSKISTPLLTEQKEIILRAITEFAKQLQSHLRSDFICVEEVITAIVSQLVDEKAVESTRVPNLNAQAVVVGTVASINSRILCAHAGATGVPTISIAHGETCGTLDEPVFGYGEHSFAETIVGYGEFGCEQAVTGNYTQPLIPSVPIKYVPSTSPLITLEVTNSPIRSALTLNQFANVVYVPTLASGLARYGPYRDINDAVYLDWQVRVLAKLSTVPNWEVTWRRHPKDSERVDIDVADVEQSSRGNFTDIIPNADLFIFDYLSSAFSIAAATNRPIVYLDYGVRNMFDFTRESIMNRCIYVQADIRHPERAITEALARLETDGEKQNTYSSAFSIARDHRPRVEIAAAVIRDSIAEIVSQ